MTDSQLRTTQLRATQPRATLNELQRKHHSESFSRPMRATGQENGDAWGNALCIEPLLPLFSSLERRTILTVGDGRGGREARHFIKLGHQVTATDLCTEMLSQAHRAGRIDRFAQANAEQLPFADNQFDFVFTKECLHHTQRPYQAVHEMLRVAREGIVIIEPHTLRRFRIRDCVQQITRRLLRFRRRSTRDELPKVVYEPCGNYLFRFDPFELTQAALAVGLTSVAYQYVQHYVWPGCGDIRGPALAAYIRRTRRRLALRDWTKGLERRPLMAFMIFKKTLDPGVVSLLRNAGFVVPKLPANPALVADDVKQHLTLRRAA